MGRKDFKLVANVAITDILLDVGNARIRTGQDQRGCIERILRKEDQLLALARDIASEGLSTAPVLVKADSSGQYVVMDGNRRVTAIKLLNDPDLCPIDGLKATLRSLKKSHAATIPSTIDVLSSTNDKAIAREVLLRHSGAQAGVGQLDWSAYLRTVYLLNHGHPPDYKRPGQYVLWAEGQGIVVEDDFPISSLQRMFTVESLKLLGFEVDKKSDELKLSMSQNTVKHMAQLLITDFANGKKVEEVFTPDLAQQYLLAVRARAGLAPPAPTPATAPSPAGSASSGPGGRPASAPAHAAGAAASTGASASAASTPPPTRASRTPRTSAAERTKLLGRSAPNIAIPTTEAKACTIVSEIRALDVKKTPLATSMLLRHLIELSDEHYRKRFRLGDKGTLAKNVSASATDMLNRTRLDKSECDIACRLGSTSSKDLLQIEMLQKVMHRTTHHPTYQLINTFWDNIAPFVRACWAK
jgi:ParB-like nuclease domain